MNPARPFTKKSTAEEVSEGVDLAGKNAIVTGANTGIGEETARVLALRGASVILACRNMKKAQAARQRIIDSLGNQVREDQLAVMLLDLNSLASVREFCQEFIAMNKPLHLLVNNAGVMMSQRQQTEDGFEAHYGVNYLSHFLLTNLLLDPLRAATSLMVATASEYASRGGLYFGECSEWPLSKPLATEDSACKALWEQSLKVVGL